MNLYFLALNVLVLVAIGLALLWPRVHRSKGPDADLPTAMQPTRDGQELTDAVTEWAKATGVLPTEVEDAASGRAS